MGPTARYFEQRNDLVANPIPDSSQLENGKSSVSEVHVFISFDIEHDRSLYDRLLAESRTPGSVFSVSGRSERSTATDAGMERVRQRIRDADQVIIICGEHTEASPGVSAEIRIAQEERTPYFLLWGRREIMCTKPLGAKPAEGIYKWTRQILQEQIVLASRKTGAVVAAEIQRNVARKG